MDRRGAERSRALHSSVLYCLFQLAADGGGMRRRHGSTRLRFREHQMLRQFSLLQQSAYSEKRARVWYAGSPVLI